MNVVPAIEPSSSQTTIVADSLATQDDRFVSARENLESAALTARTAQEQELEQYAEQIESFSIEQLITLIHNEAFFNLLETSHTTVLTKLLECTLNGASHYRNLMKIFRIILQSEIDPHLIIGLTNSLHIPDIQVEHLRLVLEHPNMKKEVC